MSSTTNPSYHLGPTLGDPIDLNAKRTQNSISSSIENSMITQVTDLTLSQNQNINHMGFISHSLRRNMWIGSDFSCTNAQTQSKDKNTLHQAYLPIIDYHHYEGGFYQQDFDLSFVEFESNEPIDLSLLMQESSMTTHKSEVSATPCVVSTTSVAPVSIVSNTLPDNLPSGLAKRQRAKKGEKRIHACHICSYVFTRGCNMREHVRRIHLNKDKHPCPQCEIQFKSKYDMKRHLRIHTSDKPYLCSMCPLSFKRIEPRNEHQKRVHNWIPPPPRKPRK
ncbi:hypothetical protein FBU30_009849 [Linnemannia zychae]|nr:hypothetical protein FBU30_009849 [Linnemannia zychae]